MLYFNRLLGKPIYENWNNNGESVSMNAVYLIMIEH